MGVAADNLIEEGVRQAEFGQHFECGGLIGPRGVGAEQEIFGRVVEQDVAQPLLVKEIKGKGNFHIDRFAGEQGAHIRPFIPAPQVGGDQLELGKLPADLENPLGVPNLISR